MIFKNYLKKIKVFKKNLIPQILKKFKLILKDMR